MSTSSEQDDPLAETVAGLLGFLEERLSALPPARRAEFAANVLLNALLSVLEEVRTTAPDRHAAYLAMAQTALGDD